MSLVAVLPPPFTSHRSHRKNLSLREYPVRKGPHRKSHRRGGVPIPFKEGLSLWFAVTVGGREGQRSSRVCMTVRVRAGLCGRGHEDLRAAAVARHEGEGVGGVAGGGQWVWGTCGGGRRSKHKYHLNWPQIIKHYPQNMYAAA